MILARVLFFAREKTKIDREKSRKQPKNCLRKTVFPREDFFKYTPEKPKTMPEKKNEKLYPRSPQSSREKHGSNFFAGIFCIKYTLVKGCCQIHNPFQL